MPLLQIRGLKATVGDKEILKGIDLTVKTGEIHAVMGPNGSGKSTLAQVLAGNPAYEVTAGSVTYDGRISWRCNRKSAPNKASSSRSNIPSRFRACRRPTSSAPPTTRS